MSTRSRKMFALPAAAAFASALMVGCAEETPVQEAQEEGSAAEAAVLDETVTPQHEVTGILGTVRQIVMTEVESEWDWDVDHDEMDLAVIADEVQVLPEE